MRSHKTIRLMAVIILGMAVNANASPKPATPREADAFIAKINQELLTKGVLWQSSVWVAANYITDDTQRLASFANDDGLAFTTRIINESVRFNNIKGLSADTARSLQIIKLGNTLLAPGEEKQRAELAQLSARMEARYGSAKWCHADAAGNQRCSSLQDIENTLRNANFTHSPQELTDAWAGWHNTARPARKDYRRFVELGNIGAREFGFKDMGELWRSGYDMSPAQFSTEVERFLLWRPRIQKLSFLALHSPGEI